MWDNVESGDTVFLQLDVVENIITPAIPYGLHNLTIDCNGTFFHPQFTKPKPKRIKHHPLTDFFKK
jgi:hypothetical protein